mmetsp:Transcript_8536/g.12671  ORF Transcript_8536/g.12671 Transcript_8536/m.12671 type:complete len:106 (-) Transcript_8536:2022-2339(-)
MTVENWRNFHSNYHSDEWAHRNSFGFCHSSTSFDTSYMSNEDERPFGGRIIGRFIQALGLSRTDFEARSSPSTKSRARKLLRSPTRLFRKRSKSSSTRRTRAMSF